MSELDINDYHSELDIAISQDDIERVRELIRDNVDNRLY